MGKAKFFWYFLFLLPICALFCESAQAAGTAKSPKLDSQAAYLIDLETRTVLFSQQADVRREPASLTKVMTTLLALEHGNLDEMITVNQSAIDAFLSNNTAEDSTNAELEVGERLTLRDLLYCVMVSSSSDACCVVAEAVSGSVPDFVELMNRRAAELGCTDTHFDNPHGLHSDTHYSTAADLAKITIAALQYDDFIDICNTASIEIPATNLHAMRYLKTTNYLLSSNTVGGYVYSRACGVKTGFTSQAGYCLISTAKNSKMSLLGVVMGASVTLEERNTYVIHSFTDMVNLFEYGFDNFARTSLLSNLDMVGEIPVTLAAAGSETAILAPVRSVAMVLPMDYDESLLKKTVSLSADSVEAPVHAGDILGTVTITYDGKLLDTVDLAAIADVDRSEFRYLEQKLQLYWEMPWVKIAVFAVAALFLLYLLRLCLPRRQRRSF